WERRPVADYGLILRRHWLRNFSLGLIAGGTFYAVYCAFACIFFDVYHFDTSRATPLRIAAALAMSLTALPVAIFQQILFSGYLPSPLRQRCGKTAGLLLPALLFGIIGGLSFNSDITAAPTSRLIIGMFLIAVVLTTVRLRLGSIALPTGLLAGAIAVRRIVRTTHLLEFDWNSSWAIWIAPDTDPRQAPLFWAMMG